MIVTIAEAERFLHMLDEGAEAFTFQTYEYDDTNKKYRTLARVINANLANGVLDMLAKSNARGCGVFVTINATDGKGRQEHNITAVRAVFVDLDGAPLGPIFEAVPAPHIVVESSPGKYHAYWRTDDCPLDQFKLVQRALARRFNGDPAVCDLPRVMRLPGFVHQKGAPVQTRVLLELCSPGRPYQLAEIIDGLHLDLSEPAPASVVTPIDGKLAAGQSRHGHLFRLGRTLAKCRAQPTREAVRAALAAENQARCDPQLPEADIDYLAQRAFTAKNDAQKWKTTLDDEARAERDATQHENEPVIDVEAAKVAARTPPPTAAAWTLPDCITEDEMAAARLSPDCVVEDYLFADVATAIAPGGTGKTTLLLREHMHIALGLPLYGLTIRKPGASLFLTAEDSRERLVARMREIGKAMSLTPAEMATVRERVLISDVSGEG